ncbi:hypothetical protein [Butyrivibrio sp. JL13D10]|uniref:hypothetical protein n=1 Tax=Butyrivibrio sp. JL13D10 TaxID=3236815 RepID=UPI0038B4DBC7
MISIFGNKLQDIDVDDIRQSAEKAITFTGDKAKSAYNYAAEQFDKLEDDKKNMIILGLSVFALVVIVAGIFYLIGKKAGRKEVSFEYEEWDS